MKKSKWSEIVIAKWQNDDIENSIDEIQKSCKRWNSLAIAITAFGVAMMCATPNPRIIAIGLFAGVTGMIHIALMKTWAHIKLSMLHVLWAQQNGSSSSE